MQTFITFILILGAYRFWCIYCGMIIAKQSDKGENACDICGIGPTRML